MIRKHFSLSSVVLCLAVSSFVVAQESVVENAREAAREAFAEADTNGDGRISEDEFTGPVRLFSRADRDGDGILTVSDFEAAMVPPDNVVATSLDPALDDETLLARLQEGGLVILFRHGETHREQTDAVQPGRLASLTPSERNANFLDCSRQRLLTDEGREKLRAIAASIRTIGIHVTDVQASPMCRTRETAWLVFGRVTPNEVLVTPRALAPRRELAGTIPESGTAAIVTHSQIVTSIVWSPANPANPASGVIPEGNAYILEPLGGSQYVHLARLGPDDWARLAELSQAD